MQITDEMVDQAICDWFEEPIEDWTRDASPEVISTWRADMRRALERAFASASATPPPASPGVPVRVAVAFSKRMLPAVSVISEGEEMTLVWADLAASGYPRRSCIVTFTAPPPAVPEIAATVLPAGEG